LTEETWKLYTKFIKENQEVFKEICEKEFVEENVYKRKVLSHPNPDMNFNLPMDMGGLGSLYNRERYSRVIFLQ